MSIRCFSGTRDAAVDPFADRAPRNRVTAYVGVPTSLGSTLLLAWERLLGEWRNSVYAHGSGPCPREGVGVRVPPRPLSALRLSNREPQGLFAEPVFYRSS